MAVDKEFLTYNQQMKKLRDKKKIDCGNTYPTEVNVANYIYANIYNLKSGVKRYSQ